MSNVGDAVDQQRFQTKRAATGAALFLAPWIDDLLRLLGAIGDAKDVGTFVLGMPPAFLFLLVQWAVATAGLALIFYSISGPAAALVMRFRAQRVRRNRLKELFPWFRGTTYDALKRFVDNSELALKDAPEPPLDEFVIHVGRLGGTSSTHAGIYRLDPELRKVAAELIAEREKSRSKPSG